MVVTLERSLIGAPKNTYTPADGFENLLGNNKIVIASIETPVLEKNSKIKSLLILNLEMKGGFTRKIALLENKDNHKVAVCFYQDDFDPKRNKQDGNLSYNVFGDISTVGQISVISSVSEKNKNRDLLFDADQLANQLAVNSKMVGLKGDNEIRLSGSGVVVMTDLEQNDFMASVDLHQAIGELFKEDRIFKNNLILPGIKTEQLIKNMEQVGAKTVKGPENFPPLINFLYQVMSKINPDVTQEQVYMTLPLLALVPYHAHYFTPKSTDLLLKYSHLEFKEARIEHVKDQIGLNIKALFPQFIS